MKDVCSTSRLEERFMLAWKGREKEDCIWWQGEWWSWNKLNDLALDCEKKLSCAGFKTGQRVALLLPNSPMVIALAIACWRLGGSVAPLNVRTGVANLLNTIKILDVHCVFVAEDRFEVSADAGKETDVPVVAAKLDSPLDQWKGREGIPENDECAIIFSTSGTSGLPKAVACSHSNLISNINAPLKHVPELLAPDSIFLNVLPNFHTFGFNMACMLPLLNGVRQAVVPNFVPVDNTINAIKDSGVNCIIAVPTIMAFLLGSLEKKNEFLPGIKLVVTGGDRLNIQMVERCMKYLGVGILEGYGLTECSPVVAVGHSAETTKLGTVGQIYDTYEINIRDREGKLLGLEEEGVLWLRGPSVVKGYFRDETNTKERFNDGWFNTGDVVQIDSDGYMKIVDRAIDIIIVSGFNVYPQEVEHVLCEHPAVRETVAVGEKNSITGELVKAFIILKDGEKATQKELMDYCKERLAHYKVPRKIGFVSEFPISPAGKILRRELRNTKIEK
jgi:long-chain acyl-CoA synthetase